MPVVDFVTALISVPALLCSMQEYACSTKASMSSDQ